jgi:choline kinase
VKERSAGHGEPALRPLKAIIYAAGRGLRLGPSYARRPKILLEFGSRSLLEWHAARLAAAGIEEMVVVSGYQREEMLRAIKTLPLPPGFEVRELFNPSFTEGSVLSLHVSLPEILASKRPLLLMDGDVLYPGVLLERLVASPHRTVLLIDRDYSTADDDPVLVPIAGGRPLEFRKRWSGTADAVGESIGFFKIDPVDFPALSREAEKRLAGSGRAEPYEEVLRALVLAGRFRHEDVTGLPWTEIDFPGDVEHARQEVWPAICRLGNG